jgi:hypothetical protein
LRTLCRGWFRTAILLFTASWVARVTGMSHRRYLHCSLLATPSFLCAWSIPHHLKRGHLLCPVDARPRIIVSYAIITFIAELNFNLEPLPILFLRSLWLFQSLLIYHNSEVVFSTPSLQ